jgi:phosphomannomutase
MGAVSARQANKLAEVLRRRKPACLFRNEGVVGEHLNDFTPPVARSIAAAFGVWLRQACGKQNPPPAVAIGSDGRPVTAEMMTFLSDGLRWAGCDVVDLGDSTAGCVAFAISHLDLNGGLLLGQPDGRLQSIGLKLWHDGCRPVSADQLEAIRRIVHSGPDRPTRKYAKLRRWPAKDSYLEDQSGLYHGLRPLRFVAIGSCPAATDFLAVLTRPTACEISYCQKPSFDCEPGEHLAGQSASDEGAADTRLFQQVLADRADFAIRIDDDGERCQLFDETGRAVDGARLLLLVTKHVILRRTARTGHGGASVKPSSEPTGDGLVDPTTQEAATDASSFGTVVVDNKTPTDVIRHLRAAGVHAVSSLSRRYEMYQAIQQHKASFGGGPDGRFWYRGDGGYLSADALVTVTHLLRILSRSDRRLSEVLDAEAAID